MYSTETKIRVNYSQVDQMGYVFFGNYPTFYEIGRTELLRELNMTPAQLEEQGVILPVRNLESEYYHPALYDELLTIKSTLKEVTALRLNFQFEIFNSEQKLINLGRVQMIFADKKNGHPRRSDDVKEKMEQKIFQHAKV
jgi:acyl-CoA thioester hydrolase